MIVQIKLDKGLPGGCCIGNFDQYWWIFYGGQWMPAHEMNRKVVDSKPMEWCNEGEVATERTSVLFSPTKFEEILNRGEVTRKELA